MTEREALALKIFISYFSEDKEKAFELYGNLEEDGFRPWTAKESLLPGQDIKLETKNSLTSSDVILICLSRKATETSGNLHRELKLAVELAEEQPQGSIFLIPVKLEKCEIPHNLENLNPYNFYEGQSYNQLVKALRIRAAQLGVPNSVFLSNKTKNEKRKPVYEYTLATLGAFLGLHFDVPKLIVGLQHYEVVVRLDAASGLGKAGDKTAVKPLTIALQDTKDKVRSKAAWALGELRDPNALPALEKMLRNDEAKTLIGKSNREIAAEAIKKIKAANNIN